MPKRNVIDAFLAEEVMGWVADDFRVCYIDQKQIAHRVEKWHPTTDLNHAFECLFALKRRWVLDSEDFELLKCSILGRFRKHDNTREGICLAICAAICAAKGWKFVIEEVTE